MNEIRTPDDGAEKRQEKASELARLRMRVEQLEAELGRPAETIDWRQGYYTAYFATTGSLLGMFGALTSLMFNILGSLMWGKLAGHPLHPLHLIQVYLTFPLGETALRIDNGMTLAIGCCLYVATGMIYGVLFQLVLARLHRQASFARRFAVASGLALAIWLVNFYGILAWLQPLVIGGDWIVELVPWWVAALTHLVFGWTMLAVYPLGLFVPYHPAEVEA